MAVSALRLDTAATVASDDVLAAATMWRFTRAVDREFVLRADGHPDVPADCRIGGMFGEKVHSVCLFITDPALATMKAGVAYSVVPRNRSSTRGWVVKDGVSIAR